MEKEKVLSIKDLSISFNTSAGCINTIRGVELDLYKGETIAIVGESGSGKSVTMKAVMGILSSNGVVNSGTINFSYYRDKEKVDVDILKLSKKEMRKRINGKRIAMIFQDPMTSLNPLIRVGEQVAEVIVRHQKVSKNEARQKAIKLFESVGINSPEQRYKQYPYEFSGGMQQRIMIAIALACEPDLLLADEPTTALDVTIQAEILKLMKKMQKKSDMSILMITHDLGVVANICDYVAVMYAGAIVEYADVHTIFEKPLHPYTQGLLSAMPTLGGAHTKLEVIEGQPPKLTCEQIVGCPFADRCKKAFDKCKKENPVMTTKEDGHLVCCHLYQ